MFNMASMPIPTTFMTLLLSVVDVADGVRFLIIPAADIVDTV